MGTLETLPVEQDHEKKQMPHGSPVRAYSAYDLIHEFTVDVLGILLPGTLFTVVVFVLVMTSGVCFLNVFRPEGRQELELVGLLGGQVNGSYAWLLLIVGYVVGGTFFRQDPRKPDEKSIERILSGSPRCDLDRWEVREGALSTKEVEKLKMGNRWRSPIYKLLGRSTAETIGRIEAAAIAHSPSAKFPYSQLKESFLARGLNHLAQLIHWSEKDHPEYRSRMSVNLLKIRLQLVAPEKCGDIVRNEAHVRMMSSVWFATKNLSVICWVSAVPVLAAVYQLCSTNHLSLLAALFSSDVLIYGALFLFVLISTFWLRRHVESCIHYQRFREVYYVLEAAFFMAQSGHPEILENLG